MSVLPTSLPMSLLLQYLSLCWFRNDPTDMVPSTSFTWKAVAFYLVSGIIVESLISDPVSGTLEVLMRAVIALSCIATLSFVMRRWNYFKQLLTAIFVCENFIMVLAMATEALDVIMVLNYREEYPEEVSIGIGVLLVVWYIAIVSYIFRQMFAYKMGRSVVSAFSYFALTYGLPMVFMELL